MKENDKERLLVTSGCLSLIYGGFFLKHNALKLIDRRGNEYPNLDTSPPFNGIGDAMVLTYL